MFDQEGSYICIFINACLFSFLLDLILLMMSLQRKLIG